MTRVRATRLRYVDEVIATLDLPKRPLTITRGIGSGLARREGDPPGTFWAVGDRGPNLKVKLAIKRYGLDHLDRHRAVDGAKVMPRPDIGPAISELRIENDTVTLVRTLPLRDRDRDRRPISGLPTPGGDVSVAEPALALYGSVIDPDPSGADTEGLAIAADGSFWIGDEYGPTLLRVAADGAVIERWVPSGLEAQFADAAYPVAGRLPAIAARRRLNRGFEALALSPDGRWLWLAFQSPLSHPDDDAHERGRHVRLWQLDAATGAVAAQYLYPFDEPGSFRRDGDLTWSDIKVSELVALGPDRLLVLERGSATTKLYAVQLDPALALGREHLDPATRPTLEQRSGAGEALPALAKQLVLTTDDLPEVDADLEGLLVLGPRSLLLVNDNDFGIEGVATRFWRIDLADDLPG